MAGDTTSTATVPASVVVPTIGRVTQLEITLDSLAACSPRATEVIVVDQSRTESVASIVERYASVGIRLLRSAGIGVALASNEGLRAAQHDLVLFTDDDCTVDPAWVKTANELLTRFPGCVLTGRVLPLGEARAVPTVAHSEIGQDHTGDVYCNVLVRSNMVGSRAGILAIGGFDERFTTSAEDDDFCYRWLRAGNCLRYEPNLLVWHRGWRREQEVQERYVRYGREQAWFYRKHLRAGDPRVLRFLGRDLGGAVRALIVALVTRRSNSNDQRPSVARGVLLGMAPRAGRRRKTRRQRARTESS